MLMKKSIGIALAAALALGASGSALATLVNVDGVTWDTSSPFNLTINSLNLRETTIAKTGDVLTGYGQIGSINGINSFCQSCDLTFTFTYTVSNITGNKVVLDNGGFQFYVDAAGSYNEALPSTASAGTAWVTLTGHTSAVTGFATTGQLFSTVIGTVSHPTSGSNGFGLVDATAGPAMSSLDIYSVSDGMGGFANLSLNSSFLFQPACKSISSDPTSVCHYPINGTGELVGATAPTTVPEPGALGLLGFGLAVLGFFGWRRRKETEGRA